MASLTDKFCEQNDINKADIDLPTPDNQIATITLTLNKISSASVSATQGAASLGNSTIKNAAEFLQQAMPKVTNDPTNDLSADMDKQNPHGTTPKRNMGRGT